MKFSKLFSYFWIGYFISKSFSSDKVNELELIILKKVYDVLPLGAKFFNEFTYLETESSLGSSSAEVNQKVKRKIEKLASNIKEQKIKELPKEILEYMKKH